MTGLPAWIDREAWDGYVEMRKLCKKPMTPRASMLVLKGLFALKEQGHSPNEALDQSTLNNWTAVYPPRQQPKPGQSFRERDAAAASAEVDKWTGGRLGAKPARDVVEMEAPTHGRIHAD